MRAKESINSSLATIFFAYNIRYGLIQDRAVCQKYIQSEILPAAPKNFEDFDILAENNLMSVFQSHCIILIEALFEFCRSLKIDISDAKMGQLDKSLVPLISLKNFLLELRNAHAHFNKKLVVFYWGTSSNSKKPKNKFKFELPIPISKKSNGIVYNFKSREIYKLTFTVNPGKVVRSDKRFIHKIILLSYHLMKLFSCRKIKTCQHFLNKYKPCLK